MIDFAVDIMTFINCNAENNKIYLISILVRILTISLKSSFNTMYNTIPVIINKKIVFYKNIIWKSNLTVFVEKNNKIKT